MITPTHIRIKLPSLLNTTSIISSTKSIIMVLMIVRVLVDSQTSGYPIHFNIISMAMIMITKIKIIL